MALTADGASLTEANRLAQLSLSAEAVQVGTALWGQLSVANLDATTPAWLAANAAIAVRYSSQAARVAGAYIGEYRDAEGAVGAGPIVQAPADRAVASQALFLAGPVRIKLLVDQGLDADLAHAAALNKFTGILSRQVLMGGRKTVALTAGQDTEAIGWRRKSDGNPCAFCAMLCSRGPVYKSADTAGDPTAGSGLRFHGHCGCTAELVYGSWEPTEAEQGYIADYNKAAREANAAGLPRTQQTVLPRLRANGSFRDSPSIRNNP